MKDGAVSSLGGIECLTRTQQLWLDAWYVKDFSPLSTLGDLTILNVYLSKGAKLPPLPQLRVLNVVNSDGDLTVLSVFPNLTSFSGHYQDLSRESALTPLRSLQQLETLNLTRSNIRDLSGLELLSKLVTIDLSMNDVSDISPLLKNAALRLGTSVDLRENPITCDDPSVKSLLERKVEVQPCGP